MSLVATLKSGQRRCQASWERDGLLIQCSKGLSNVNFDAHTFCSRCRLQFTNGRACSPNTRCPECKAWPREKMILLAAKPSYAKRKQASEAKKARLSRLDTFEQSRQSRLTVTPDQRVRLEGLPRSSSEVNLLPQLSHPVARPGSSSGLVASAGFVVNPAPAFVNRKSGWDSEPCA